MSDTLTVSASNKSFTRQLQPNKSSEWRWVPLEQHNSGFHRQCEAIHLPASRMTSIQKCITTCLMNGQLNPVCFHAISIWRGFRTKLPNNYSPLLMISGQTCMLQLQVYFSFYFLKNQSPTFRKAKGSFMPSYQSQKLAEHWKRFREYLPVLAEIKHSIRNQKFWDDLLNLEEDSPAANNRNSHQPVHRVPL